MQIEEEETKTHKHTDKTYTANVNTRTHADTVSCIEISLNAKRAYLVVCVFLFFDLEIVSFVSDVQYSKRNSNEIPSTSSPEPYSSSYSCCYRRQHRLRTPLSPCATLRFTASKQSTIPCTQIDRAIKSGI